MSVLPVGFGSAAAGGTPANAISRSLRFNSADSAYLSRTFGTPTNNLKWTMSMWVKRGEITIPHMLFCAPLATSSNFAIWFSASGSSSNGDFINYHIPNVGSRPFITNAVYRDTSAWYHFVFVFDSANATQADRFILYVNNARQTASTASVALNQACAFNQSGVVGAIGGSTGGFYGTKSDYFDGYMTEINFIDGQALTPSDFGETDSATGVWKPKAYSSTYGTNGFYLKFADNSGTTSTTLGKDSSGNGNNWTPNNFSVTAGAGNDSLVDSPTSYGTDTGVGGEVRGNYCTWNRLQTSSSITLNNGNLDGTISGGFLIYSAAGTIEVKSGKWYYETVVTAGHSTAYPIVGVCDITQVTSGINTSFYSSSGSGNSTGIIAHATGTSVYLSNNTSTTDGVSYNKTSDVLMIAFDSDLGKVWFGKNGTWNNSSNPATNSGGHTFSTVSGNGYRPYVQCNADTSNSWTSNFGQRAFAYTAPSGFKALCTQNLPTPTIGATSTTQANDYFNVVLWTGNSSASQAITGVGFQPDLVWAKARPANSGQNWVDAVRGATKNIRSNSTDAEATVNTVISFQSDGFTVGDGNGYDINKSGESVVGWCWNAGGSNATNTSGTITSTVRANTTSGFSIVTYTGNGSANQTVGHGLGVAPAFGILKDRDTNSNNNQWQIFHTGAGDKYGYFTTAAFAGTAEFYPTSGSSTTVTIARSSPAATTNESGDNYVMYLFAPVAGYSAFGSYTGNGSSDGPFVYTGFRPAFVMFKNSQAVSDWWIYDTKRNTFNVMDSALRANLSNAELTYAFIDTLSNGFKLRNTGGDGNRSGETIIYMAFAETPAKFSLAR